MVSHVSSNSIQPAQRTRYCTTPLTVLKWMIATTSHTSTSSSSMSWGTSRLLNTFSNAVCTTLCQRVPSGTSNRYTCDPIAFMALYGTSHFWVKDLLLPAFTCKLRLSTSNQASMLNCLAFSMWMVLRFSLIRLMGSWIWLRTVVILSNHSSAAWEESSYSLSRCIVRGSKPYKLPYGE